MSAATVEKSKFELVRNQSAHANKAFLESLNIQEERQIIFANARTQRPSKRINLVVKSTSPQRKSLRLRNKPAAEELPKAETQIVEEPVRPRRKVLDNLPESDCLVSDNGLSDEIRSNTAAKLQKNKKKSRNSNFEAEVGLWTLNDVHKVTPDRITALTCFSSRAVAVAGDKRGRIGVYDHKSGVTSLYEAHSEAIHNIQQRDHSVFSVSYDGTLREWDLQHQSFKLVHHSNDENDTGYYGLDFVSGDVILLGRTDGQVELVDRRENRSTIASAHARCVKSISCHPTDDNYFLTGSGDGRVSLRDLRVFSTENGGAEGVVAEVTRGRSVNCASFSPLTGNFFAVTSLDDTITIYDASSLSQCKLKTSIRHNNYTGRWLSAFRASWVPTREDFLVVGSLQQPRRIEMWGIDGTLRHKFENEELLKSVTSLNVFHPTERRLFGANSSGRVFVFGNGQSH